MDDGDERVFDGSGELEPLGQSTEVDARPGLVVEGGFGDTVTSQNPVRESWEMSANGTLKVRAAMRGPVTCHW